jgi:3-oxoacyl-[acyl-carrier protein] reductase
VAAPRPSWRSVPGTCSPGSSSGSTATSRRSPSTTRRRSTGWRRRSALAEFCSLEGKAALVTGGSRGIGRAIALELARAGASVTLGYRSGKDEAEEVADDVGGQAVQADVSDPAQAKQLVDEAGELDILVNNAGLTRDGLIARMSDEDWSSVIGTNLNGVFHTCRAAARGMMKRRRGAIVNISSIVGVHGNPGQTNYSASKAGIIGFTKALARELGARSVRANVVAPGYIDTRLTQVLEDELRAAMLAGTPLGRFGDPEDVAGAVRFLCSDEASFITGEVLLVDGGLGM